MRHRLIKKGIGELIFKFRVEHLNLPKGSGSNNFAGEEWMQLLIYKFEYLKTSK